MQGSVSGGTDDVQLLSPQEGVERGKGDLQHLLRGLFRVEPDVRGEQDVGQRGEEVIRGQRLLLMDVESGAR
jgi:hypothetical protein